MKSNTINKKEIEKFSKIASQWWDPNGKFKPLHNFNPIRIEYIKNSIIKHFKIKSSTKSLKKINILDIGCGGGLLSGLVIGLNGQSIVTSVSKIAISSGSACTSSSPKSSHVLTNIGLEVESVENLSADNELFKIAKIVKTSPRYVGRVCGQNKHILAIPCHVLVCLSH